MVFYFTTTAWCKIEVLSCFRTGVPLWSSAEARQFMRVRSISLRSRRKARTCRSAAAARRPLDCLVGRFFSSHFSISRASPPSFLIPGQSRLEQCELDGRTRIRKHVKRELTNDATVFSGVSQLIRNPSMERRIVAHRWREQLSQRNSGIELGSVLKVSKHQIPTLLIHLKSIAHRCYSVPRLSEIVFR